MYKFRNLPSLFTNLYIFFFFLRRRRVSKEIEHSFWWDVEEWEAHENVYSTRFVFSYLKKNYPLLLEMYNNYIKLDQSKDEYAPLQIYFEHFAHKAKGWFYLLRCNSLLKRTWVINNQSGLYQSRKFDLT